MLNPLDTASSLLWWSNVLYVVGAVLTLGTSALVLFEKRQIGKGIEVKHSVRNEVFFVTSALICLAGTCGAIYFGSRVSKIKDADLATYKITAGVQIAQANQQAANANVTAGEANKNAAEADKHLAAANQQAADANKKAAEANVAAQQAVLDKTKILHDNLVLQQQITQEQTAREQIQQQLAPRSMTPQAQQRLVGQLRPLAKQDVDFVIFPGDPEAENLERQIAWACQQVGWEIHGADPMGGSAKGVTIEFDAEVPGVREAADAITLSLTSSGMEAVAVPSLPPFGQQFGAYTSDGKAGNGKIRVIIGSK